MKSNFLTGIIFLCLSFISAQEGIIVHVIPHSHDDVGWLVRARNYYSGNNRLGQCVKCIFDGILISLSENPERTFVEVEMYYFHKWWIEQNDQVKATMKEFVNQGRLEFTNAGWSMHDEANTSYQDQIDNERLGLRFLKEEFDYDVETGWAIDPFGHSITNVIINF